MLPNTPLVSIIMLTYNRANYIAQAIESVLAQTYQQWELLILDDGSTDNTAVIVSQYSDSRIQYLFDPINKGLALKRYESLKQCRGVYVAILDSDDKWIDVTKLDSQVTYLNNHPTCVVVGTQINLIDESGNSLGTNTYLRDDTAIRNAILVRNQFAHSSVMMRKSFLDKTSGYQKLSASEDLDLYLRLGQLGTFANLPETMLAYRIHKKSASANKIKILQGVLRTIKTYRQQYPHYQKAYLKFSMMLFFAKIRNK